MKKIIVVILISIFSFQGYSQSSTYRIKEIKKLCYNDVSEEWTTLDTTYPSKMYAVFKGLQIKINDSQNSKYTLYGESKINYRDNYMTATWDAIDDNNKNCKIIFQTINPYDEKTRINLVYAIYESFTFLYSLEKVN